MQFRAHSFECEKDAGVDLLVSKEGDSNHVMCGALFLLSSRHYMVHRVHRGMLASDT